MKFLKHKELKNIYTDGKSLATINMVDGVKGISPHSFDVLRMVRFSSFCDQHSHSVYSHVAFCCSAGDYTDLVGPGIYIGSYAGKPRAVIFGHMNHETQLAFMQNPGEATALKCGCILARIPDEEVAPVIDGKPFVCGYTSGHLVDER